MERRQLLTAMLGGHRVTSVDVREVRLDQVSGQEGTFIRVGFWGRTIK